ncbi:MAG TPA: peptidyl-prolyl cis-trans isomerase [Candidatus Mediterraneibacter excrementigallinarum]|nr:peptidyl-prolyl cis-trans isomerase [Candidatus Mediterraneibacter excrementigallinarum]
MMRFGKRAAVLAMAGVFGTACMTGCSGSLDTDAVVATVGGEDVTLGVANFYARMQQGQYETYYAGMMGTTPEEMWSQEYTEGTTLEDETKDGVLEMLEDLYVISQHADEYEVALTEDEEKAISDAAAQFDADNTDEAKEAVSGYRKDVEKLLELLTIQNKMEKPMKEGVDEEVSDEEAAQKSMQYVYFPFTTTDDSGNSTEMTDEEKEDLRSAAQDFDDQVKDGEDFESAAESADVEVRTTTFDSESTSPDADLIAAADALEAEGDVTDVIETDSGLYVARLTSLLDRDATDQEKQNIVEQRRQDQYDSLLEDWRDAADITVNEKVWAKVDFEDQGVTIITSETEDGTADDNSQTDESTDTSDASGSSENTDEAASGSGAE